MVDVGAHHGGTLALFAHDGWKIIAIEPDPANRAILSRDFPTIAIDPRAIGERDGEQVTLYTSGVSSGISTLNPFHPSHRATSRVETVRLDTLLTDVSEVTLLKTDTEGWDLPVLRTFPWDRLHPLAVIAEFDDHKTVPLGYDWRDLAEFLVDRGFAVEVSEWYPVVEYGRPHRWRSVRPFPVELADAAAWGNLIATAPELRRG
jgi:FkbM family methyltransferase